MTTLQVHVDEYQDALYNALRKVPSGFSGAGCNLQGFKLGNQHHEGLLTTCGDVRLHSCEPGTGCPALDDPSTVWILPIITRDPNGTEVPEVGAGKGGGRLHGTHELILEDESCLKTLTELCIDQITDPLKLESVLRTLRSAYSTSSRSLPLDELILSKDDPHPSIRYIISRLAERSELPSGLIEAGQSDSVRAKMTSNPELPRAIVSIALSLYTGPSLTFHEAISFLETLIVYRADRARCSIRAYGRACLHSGS